MSVRRRRLEGRECRVGRSVGFLLWPLCFVTVDLRSAVLQCLEYTGLTAAEVGGRERQLGEDVTGQRNGSLYRCSVGVSVCAKWTLHSGSTAEGVDSRRKGIISCLW